MRNYPIKYYIWTLLAVLGLAATDVWGALQPPTTALVQSPEYTAHHALGETPTMLTLATITKDGHTRAPASIGASPIANALALNEAADYKVPCKGELEVSYPTTITQLRLASDACRKREPVTVAVENTTNGFSATVFPQPRGYSTDYITLAKGSNVVAITLTFKDGSTEKRELTVSRE